MQGANRSPRRTRVTKTLWPPQAGTIKLTQQFGESLLCVRYRHDTSGLRRFTTVELVVGAAAVIGQRAHSRLYAVHLPAAEEQLREQVQGSGASWDQQARLWIMNGAQVKALGLEDHARPLGKTLGKMPGRK